MADRNLQTSGARTTLFQRGRLTRVTGRRLCQERPLIEENILRDQIKDLIIRAIDLCPRNNRRGIVRSIPDNERHADKCTGWIADALNIVELVPPAANAYKREIKGIAERASHSSPNTVARMAEMLRALLADIDAGITTQSGPTINVRIKTGSAFIAMAIDKDDHQLVDVLEAIKDAAANCAITAERVDEVESNARITDRMLELITKATKERPNVFYEAGFAHGLGKVPIYVARAGTPIHFDVKDYPIIMFRNMKELKEGITRRLIALKHK
jgi:hypothetical protein